MLKTTYQCTIYAIKRNKKILPLGIIYMITAGLLPVFAVFMPKLIIDEVLKESQASSEMIIWYCLIYFIITGVLYFISHYLNNVIKPLLTDTRIDLLSDLFDKLTSLDYHYMENSKFFDEHERALNATNSNSDGYEGLVNSVFQAMAYPITIIFYIIILCYLNYIIILGIFLSIVIGYILTIVIQKLEYKYKDKIGHARRKMNYFYTTTHDFSYGKDIRVYRFEDKISQGYNQEINNYLSIIKKVANRNFLFSFIELLGVLISDVIIYFILINEAKNGLSIADFSMYLAACLALTTSCKLFSSQLLIINNAHLSCRDLFMFLKNDFNTNSGQLKKLDDTFSIEFVDVSFKYPNSENYIFENLNFKIEKGEKIAIVGVNGAGKTTLVKLMMRLFEPTKGQILINGIDSRQFDKKEYYRMFSVVFQEINILSFSLRDNITLGHAANDDLIWLCLEKVGLSEKLSSLPQGLDTMLLKNIDENGLMLSGGEMQKLAIARALYKNGNVVILDEPTSALDALAEASIYQDFNELVVDKTSIYISHRLASTKFCHRIVLFNDKQVCEQGSHEQLMALRGYYYNMFITQGKYYQDEEIKS